ncbi:MAG: tRNA lysidine(34) synthetase TilS [Prevotella sp.]|nr:tRNA lysidine(34) synthetase TilS [Prevotella sp.]
MTLTKQVEAYIADHRLLNKSRVQLVALSGGADSVCLLLMLGELGYRLEAVHCNFRLRGEESDRDEAFCRELCRRKQIPFHVAHFDTRLYARTHKVSIEMAARTLRYSYFEKLREDLNAETVCVAHHADDNAETLLLNLIRGTGIRGLSGMRPLNGHVARPLLCLRHDEIVEWLAKQGETFMTDTTNLEDAATRNRIRHQLLPLFETFNPSIVETLNQTAGHLSQSADLCDTTLGEMASCVFDGKRINLTALEATPVPRLLLFHLLHPMGFNASQIEQINRQRHGDTGRIWHSSTHRLLLDRGFLVAECQPFKPTPSPHPSSLISHPFSLPIAGHYRLPDGSSLSVALYPRAEAFAPSRQPHCATLDADRARFPLTVRTIRPADRFRPFGMKGSTLLSDFLTDKKINRFQKQRQLVVEDGDGEIIWVVGLRTGEQCRITEQTTRILRLDFIENHE